MSADLSIHVFDDSVTMNDLAIFRSSNFGSRYFTLSARYQADGSWHEACSKISKTPSIEIGPVSWLKAAFVDDPEEFVPGPIQRIQELIGGDDPKELTPALAWEITEAFYRPNNSIFDSEDIVSVEEVRVFLRQHMGKRVFTVSW